MVRRRTAVIDTESAQVGRTSDGAVVFDDSGAPWVVRVWPAAESGRIRRIRVDVRAGGQPITASALGRLPIAQMVAIAASSSAQTRGQQLHTNEVFYRLLAKPKQHRSWDDGHWERVLTVFDWARLTRRPGGGARAVADLWGVSVNPTVWRWLAEARRRARPV